MSFSVNGVAYRLIAVLFRAANSNGNGQAGHYSSIICDTAGIWWHCDGMGRMTRHGSQYCEAREATSITPCPRMYVYVAVV